MLNTPHQQLYDKNPVRPSVLVPCTALYTLQNINKHPQNVVDIYMEIQPRVQSRRINEVYFGKLIIFHFIPNHIIGISGNSKLVHLWGSSGQMFPWGDGELLRKTIMSTLNTVNTHGVTFQS